MNFYDFKAGRAKTVQPEKNRRSPAGQNGYDVAHPQYKSRAGEEVQKGQRPEKPTKWVKKCNIKKSDALPLANRYGVSHLNERGAEKEYKEGQRPEKTKQMSTSDRAKKVQHKKTREKVQHKKSQTLSR